MYNLLRKTVFPMIMVLLAAGSAQATVYTEDFEQPFPTWESNWFGTMSNARNVYCLGAQDCASRGNNPDGLWLWGPNGIDVAFDSTFGSSLTSLSFGVAAYAGFALTAYDMNGNQIFNQTVTPTFGAYSDPGNYAYYTITSNNGISHFGFSDGASGSTSIDNLTAITQQDVSAVPEPASLGLLALGLLSVVATRRRTSTK